MYRKIGFCLVLLAVSQVLARSVSEQSIENVEESSSSSSGFLGDLSFLFKTYQQCSKKDVSTCLKVKLIANMDKASKKVKDFEISNGIKFVQDTNVLDNSNRTMSEHEIERDLPRSLEEKDNKLNSLIFDKIFSFLQSHTLQIKFPTAEEMQRSFEESRGKKKKKGNGAFVMIPLLLGGTFVPIAYGALALLAGKALIVSKLALVLASIIGIKKLLSGSTGKESQHEVVVSGGHGGSGWGRDFDLAYNAYLTKDKNKALYGSTQ